MLLKSLKGIKTKGINDEKINNMNEFSFHNVAARNGSHIKCIKPVVGYSKFSKVLN